MLGVWGCGSLEVRRLRRACAVLCELECPRVRRVVFQEVSSLKGVCTAESAEATLQCWCGVEDLLRRKLSGRGARGEVSFECRRHRSVLDKVRSADTEKVLADRS